MKTNVSSRWLGLSAALAGGLLAGCTIFTSPTSTPLPPPQATATQPPAALPTDTAPAAADTAAPPPSDTPAPTDTVAPPSATPSPIGVENTATATVPATPDPNEAVGDIVYQDFLDGTGGWFWTMSQASPIPSPSISA